MRPRGLTEKLAALSQRAVRGMALGLDRVEDALSQLGNPQRDLAVVHIAGSNGKGSTSAMIESIARAAGLRTGLTTSPHLSRFAERIRLDGEPLGDEAMERALAAVLEGCRPDLTFFESLTIAAFHAFREARVDLAVLEVGLGGRLDATNVVASPVATAITSITLEHTVYLGETLDLIAREKAGILKRGAPVVLGPLDDEADRAIAAVAAQVGAGAIVRVTRGERAGVGTIAARWNGATSTLTGPGDEAAITVALGLEGPHQAENAGVALGLAQALRGRFAALGGAGFHAHVERGLREARWPGRMERIERDGVTVILDCAHNPQGMRALRATLDRLALDPERTALVFGALADKRWPEMLGAVSELAARRYYATPKGRAPAALEELQREAAGDAVGEPREAIARAIAASRAGDTVLVTGSIYLVGEVRSALLGIEEDPVIAL
ncbi:MAG: folylpolyglutamate synthase/dihydrofolate synthase family protein [Minicystis sp.]